MTYQFPPPKIERYARRSVLTVGDDAGRFGCPDAAAPSIDKVKINLHMALVLAVCAIVLRWPDFGNPTFHVDETFYLYFGEKMNEGLAPYSEVWDRKPFGLFILYSLIARLGGVYAYQAAAMAFVWGTALAIAAISLRFMHRTAATAAGIFYISMLGVFGGGGGQSPVFYNLFIALAALMALSRLLGEKGPRLVGADVLAMFLCGLALTIKPTALPECLFFGLALLLARWRANRAWTPIVWYALKLCSVAVLPTALILARFWMSGDLDEYLFATVQSIFLTSGHPVEGILRQLANIVVVLSIPLVLALVGLARVGWRNRLDGGNGLLIAGFVGGWLVAAIAGFAMVPNYFGHYVLPLTSVLAVAAAAAFEKRPLGYAAAIIAIGQMLVYSGFPGPQMARTAKSRQGYEQATALIRQHVGAGCVFLYDVNAALYHGVKSCPANKYAFPEHLSNAREAGAIGADPLTAMRAVFADKPSVIVYPVEPSVYTPNIATRAALERFLRSEYQKVGSADLHDFVGDEPVTIWRRKAAADRENRSRRPVSALAE